LTGALGGLDGGAKNTAGSEGAAPSRDTLGDVFEDFRNEAGRQNSADQSAQHMTLARTYFEMGMQDEAIASLKTASKAPRFRFEAAALLGRIYEQRAEMPQAIEWLERAAEAPAPSADAGRALLYNLGMLVEQSGDTARALAVYLELQSEAGDYRDVPERIERLARVETGG
jgi:tetratricopeptide (TPR) repeat protein